MLNRIILIYFYINNLLFNFYSLFFKSYELYLTANTITIGFNTWFPFIKRKQCGIKLRTRDPRFIHYFIERNYDIIYPDVFFLSENCITSIWNDDKLWILEKKENKIICLGDKKEIVKKNIRLSELFY